MHKVGGTAADRSDPDYAPTVEVFDQLPYDEIYRGVLQMDPEVLTAGRQAWQGAATGLSDAVQQAHAEIRGAVADGWRGSAAQQAVGAMQAFQELGQHVADVMSTVAERLGQANDAAETLRAAVTRPTAVSTDLQAALLDPKRATLNVAAQKQAEGLRQDMVRVMDTVYAGAFLPTGNGIPAFREGGMYPSPQPPAPVPDGSGGPDATSSLVGPQAAVPGAVVSSVPPQPDTAEQVRPGEEEAAGSDAPRPESEAPASTAPAAATAPASAPEAAAAPVADRPAATQPAAANAVAPQPERVVPAATGAAPAAVAVGPAAVATTPQSSEDNRKRDEKSQPRHESGADPVSGMGAGIVGGLAGGAFAAAGDTVRSGSGVPVPPKRSPDDEDDDEFYDFDEPTFLDPAEPGNDLVGRFDPTTPPVVGEWAEDD
ncbi:WXG100 family type VII secretion target [Nocardia sp. BMG51109]|uniref:WXG100 family type VII secretion target n=1 Tax=Nocardia sp. BMG51109 TaxID=1056816 RepID=UPI000A060722|nr:WXG100 family type VII secretion target [Nocardia sp. BMG51109]